MTKSTVHVELLTVEEFGLFHSFLHTLKQHRSTSGHPQEHNHGHHHAQHPEHVIASPAGYPQAPQAPVPPQGYAPAGQPNYAPGAPGPVGAPHGGYPSAPAAQGGPAASEITFQHIIGLQSELLNNRVINHGQVMAIYQKHGVQPGHQPAPHLLSAIYHELAALKPQQ